ncbi:hypothetical protein J5Y09_19980 [Roseomonas sp. PWR1]|uniref:Uncharacterized protein n=1 Tax=Roseomonas nitratireducens TaxID=2820810 RepID=A0ABS4AXW0_9PROT|nr:hypothetical protein [Neoroseomonas nitratireducens]MBP0466216.1 hypothetical protein [Neoroseomonas nitratireducens]
MDGVIARGVPVHRQYVVPVALFILVCMSCVPLFVAPVPPLVDYPNHLARLWLIAGGAAEPPLNAFYVVDWARASTNIGVDLLALVLAPTIGVEAVGRLAVAFALLMPIAGALALGRIVAGAWHLGLLPIPVLAWNINFAAGFLNQQIAIGAALLTAAALAATQPRLLVRTVVVTVAGAAIFVIHLAGAAALAGLAGALAFGERYPTCRLSWLRALRRACLGAAPIVLAVAALMHIAESPPGVAGEGTTNFVFWTWQAKAKVLVPLLPFLVYAVAEGVALALVLVLLATAMARAGRLVQHAGLALLAGVLIVAAVILPSSIGDTTQIEFRCAWLSLICLLAALRPGPWPMSRAIAGAAAMLVAVGTAKAVWKADIWRRGAAEIAAVDRAVSRLPVGSILLPVSAGAEGNKDRPRGMRLAIDWPLHMHLGHRAVNLRGAFVPGLFSTAGKQPVRVLEPWRAWSVAFDQPPSVTELRAARDGRDWRGVFTHLLLLDADGVPTNALPEGLEALADEGFARLYRVIAPLELRPIR